MTTYVSFSPSLTAPFQFTATFDGALYTVSVLWNFAAQRWYVQIIDQFANLIVNRALIGSPPLNGLSSLTWADGVVTAVAADDLSFPLGANLQLAISQTTPSTYNGVYSCTVISGNSLTYPLADDPGGDATVPGSWSADINLVAGFFDTSTLVFRESTQLFEIAP